MSTVLLIHSNITDGSVVFADSSFSGHTIAANGDAHHEIDQSKFGTTSIYFDGTGDYLSIPDSDDFNMGSGDFTQDFWIKRNRTGQREAICGQSDSGWNGSQGNLYVQIETDDTVLISGGDDSGLQSYSFFTNSTIADTDWHHFAIVRSGNTISFYLDGVADSQTADVTGRTLTNQTTPFAIGRAGDGDGIYFQGYIDEFRVVRGSAEWTSNFTPPTEAYTVEGNVFNMTVPLPTIVLGSGATVAATIPMPELLISDGGATFIASIPMPTLVMSSGAIIAASIPMPTLVLGSGASISASIPMPTLDMVVIGENPSDIVAEIPMLVLTMTGSLSETLDAFDMEIPMPTLVMNQAGGISAEIPFPTLTIEANTTKVANIKATIPMPTLVARSGSYIEMEIPSVSMVMAASTVPADVELTADIDLTIPFPQIRIISIPDDVIEASIPMPTLSMIVQQTGDNDFTLTVPMPIIRLDSGDIISDALRYIRGLVR